MNNVTAYINARAAERCARERFEAFDDRYNNEQGFASIPAAIERRELEKRAEILADELYDIASMLADEDIEALDGDDGDDGDDFECHECEDTGYIVRADAHLELDSDVGQPCCDCDANAAVVRAREARS